MGLTLMAQLREDFEYLALQGVVRADHADARREVTEVGSVS